jgi:hypothetical protein
MLWKLFVRPITIDTVSSKREKHQHTSSFVTDIRLVRVQC